MSRNDAPVRHLIITGGTGYIGARLVDMALAEGRQVTILGRHPGPRGTRHVSWTLGADFPAEASDPALPPEAQALVHLAHAWDGGDAVNVHGTKALFDGARAAGVGRSVFISSQSARQAALNRYGRMKWATEQLLPDAASLRVGLVYGGPLTAMYGLLCRITRLPVLPMIDPHRTVQPIHRDEVVQGIFGAVDKDLKGVFALAGPDPVPFGVVLKSLARAFTGRSILILPVPIRLALLGCDVTAKLPVIPTVDRERVLGLAGTEPIEAAADLATLGVAIRPMAERLAQEPAGRRALIAEARAFIRHASGNAASPALLARYARACPDGAIGRPRLLLRWREPIGGQSQLARRLRLASRIAETSADTEASLASGTRITRLARLGVSLIADTLMLPTRLAATLLTRSS